MKRKQSLAEWVEESVAKESHLRSLRRVVEALTGPPPLRDPVSKEDLARLRRSLDAVESSSPEDIRAQGWTVAVHNDYHLKGKPHTFWLFTKGRSCVKGEGLTDEEALNEVRAKLLSRTRKRERR